jgi:hypothetical protein
MEKQWLVRLTRDAYDLADENGRVDNSTGCIYVRQLNLTFPELKRVDVSTTVISFTDDHSVRHYFSTPTRVTELLYDFKAGMLWGGIASEYPDLVEEGIVLKDRNGRTRGAQLPPTAKQREERARKAALRKDKYAKETPAQRQAREAKAAQRRGKHRGTVAVA